MKINKIKRIILITIIMFFSICLKNEVKATTINISPKEPKVGETVKITVSISNVNTATITANVSGAASGKIKLVGGNISKEASNYSETKEFVCTKVGTISVETSSDSVAILNGEYVNAGASASVVVTDKEENKNTSSAENNTSSNGSDNTSQGEKNTLTSDNTETSIPTTTTPTETKKSSNANLSDLGIRPNDFKGFKPGNTSYNVTVPNDVEKVEIYAKTQDVNAKATGGGSKKLSVGDNSFNVTVTAEDGKTKKIYTINIKREEAVSEKNDTSKNEVLSNEVSEKEIANQTANEIAEETIAKEDKGDKGDLNKLDVQGYTLSPVFSPNVYEYKLTVSEDVTSLDVKAEATNSNVQVEIAGNKDLKEGENVITIMCYNKETKKNTTYQIIAEKKAKEDTHAEAINEAYKKRNLIIKVGIALIIILIVACIVVFKKDKEGNEKEFQQIEKDTKNEKETKHEIRNLNIEENMDNEEKPLAMQRKKAEIKKENISNVKTQKQREEEFDEKLQRLKNEKRKEQKGGKHF